MNSSAAPSPPAAESLFAALPAPALALGRDGTLRAWNRACAERLGWSAALLGAAPPAPAWPEQFAALSGALRAGAPMIELRLHGPDRTICLVRFHLASVGDLALLIAETPPADQGWSRLAALQRVDQVLAAGAPLAQALDLLIAQALAELGLAGAALIRFNRSRLILEPLAACGALAGLAERRSLAISGDITSQAALSGRAARGQPLDGGRWLPMAAPLLVRRQVYGVLLVHGPAHDSDDPRWLSFLDALAGRAALLLASEDEVAGLSRSYLELFEAYEQTVESWARSLDMRDREAEGHTLRVTELALRLAQAVGLAGDQLRYVRWGALLHDIGKLAIPDSILLKPGPLSAQEWEVMRMHPIHAHRLLAPIEYLRPALEIPWCHHERWDGRGYPRGLRGTEIPLAARVFAVADVWDALRSDRPYRQAWAVADARKHIAALAGSQFDPGVVEVFLAMGDAM